MSYANNITRLCELAAREYLKNSDISGIAPDSIHAGFDDDNIPTPRVTLTCNNAEPDGSAEDAVWACTLEVTVISNADDKTETQHHDLAGEAFSYFMIGRQLTAEAISGSYTGFGCVDVLPTGQTKTIQERRWVSVLTLRVICFGTDAE